MLFPLPSTTHYTVWDTMRRERFTFDTRVFVDVTVKHLEYETTLAFAGVSDAIVATWDPDTGLCTLATKRQAIFLVLTLTRNYMMNALDAWLKQDDQNLDGNLPWGVLFYSDAQVDALRDNELLRSQLQVYETRVQQLSRGTRVSNWCPENDGAWRDEQAAQEDKP